MPMREAQKALAALVAGPAPTGPAAAMTTGQMLEQWFEQAEPNLSPSTADHTRVVLDAHLLPHIGETPLRKLTTAKVDALYRLLSERGGRGGKPLAPATVRRTHNVLHRALGQAVRWGWLAVNPAAASSPPRLPSRDIKPPSPEQLRLLFVRAAEENPAFAVFLQLAAATGARRGELVALCRSGTTGTWGRPGSPRPCGRRRSGGQQAALAQYGDGGDGVGRGIADARRSRRRARPTHDASGGGDTGDAETSGEEPPLHVHRRAPWLASLSEILSRGP
jgi:hypothetical protein